MELKVQTRFGYPEGNCLQSCIACLLGCEIEDLPAMTDPKASWQLELNEYLQRVHGLIYLEVPFDENLMWWGDSIVLGLGPSDIPNAPGHAVLVRAKIVEGKYSIENIHDPMPAGKFLPRIDAFGVLVKQFKEGSGD